MTCFVFTKGFECLSFSQWDDLPLFLPTSSSSSTTSPSKITNQWRKHNSRKKFYSFFTPLQRL